MATILIQPDVVIFANPCMEKPDKHKWWAEGGLIHWENLDCGRYKQRFGSMTVVECLDRLRGHNDMIGNNRTNKGWNFPDEMQKFRAYIDGMIELCKKAKQQGMPDDANHSRQMVAEIKEKRKSRMVVPGMASARW